MCYFYPSSTPHPHLHSFPTRRSSDLFLQGVGQRTKRASLTRHDQYAEGQGAIRQPRTRSAHTRSEEHTSELQSRPQLVCRLLLEKKKSRIARRDKFNLLLYLKHICIV